MSTIIKRTAIIALVVVFSVLLTIFAAAVEPGIGNVKGTNVNVRSAPNTDSAIITQVNTGDKVYVQSLENNWYSVKVDGKDGYIRSDLLDYVETDSIEASGMVNATNVNMRTEPNTTSTVIVQLNRGAQVVITGIHDNWYKLTYNGTEGYIRGDFITIGGEAGAAGGTAATDPDASQVDKLLAEARSHLGTKYRSGGSTPKGFDCSGYTSYCYKQIGVSINRTASNQLDNGVPVDRSELQPGDLVFFNNPNTPNKRAGHVGIYVGDGNFIHSSSGGGAVEYDSLSQDYYNRNYIGARRVLGQ